MMASKCLSTIEVFKEGFGPCPEPSFYGYTPEVGETTLHALLVE